MSEELDFERFTEIKERMHELSRVVEKQRYLNKRIREQEVLIVKLEVELEMEQEDVEKLTRLSLMNLFHTILRSKTDQLELERQQELIAVLKLQEAKQILKELKEELLAVGEQYVSLSNAGSDYNELMLRKETALRNSPHTVDELEEMEEHISHKSLLLKEIKEALSAGRGVLSSLTYASEHLEKAENWGNWDLWANGGLLSTHIKHEHIDDAKTSIHNANRQLQDLHKELSDLDKSTNIHIDISGTLKMADYWFDGLISDWLVQGRIKDAQEQVLRALEKLRIVVKSLEVELSNAEKEVSQLKAKRIAWIEETQ
ncbi:hypothetical protein [Paenibacillus sp. L3-i20]|uniref:hypothetical protein n=1 Tax=Paenibacillus sp. L3-i20 TaxID=2905833 RepID=UPI001EE0C3C8|nr:hypothetical protein [Paenibacillus sp. L3-i20]GKU80567.1 hypothetical protein L3i20_v249640 [Paenibacillus sp. L3-i20]